MIITRTKILVTSHPRIAYADSRCDLIPFSVSVNVGRKMCGTCTDHPRIARALSDRQGRNTPKDQYLE